MKRYIKSAVFDALNEDVNTRLEIAESTSSPELLDRLSYDNVDAVVFNVLLNPNTSAKTLRRFTQPPYTTLDSASIQADLAFEHPNMDVEVLRSFRQYPRFYENIVRNPSTPTDVLEKMAYMAESSGDSSLLGCIVANPNAPVSLLQRVLTGDNDRVRNKMALNLNLSYEMQSYLAEHCGKWGKMNLAGNPNLHPDIRKKLASDADSEVAFFAKAIVDDGHRGE